MALFLDFIERDINDWAFAPGGLELEYIVIHKACFLALSCQNVRAKDY